MRICFYFIIAPPWLQGLLSVFCSAGTRSRPREFQAAFSHYELPCTSYPFSPRAMLSNKAGCEDAELEQNSARGWAQGRRSGLTGHEVSLGSSELPRWRPCLTAFPSEGNVFF